jgi:hypothetical protein
MTASRAGLRSGSAVAGIRNPDPPDPEARWAGCSLGWGAAQFSHSLDCVAAVDGVAGFRHEVGGPDAVPATGVNNSAP